MSRLNVQLPLQVQLDDSATFDNFLAEGRNQQLVANLKQLQAADEHFYYLYGSDDSGCSHLLQATCHYVQTTGLQSLYFPLDELIAHPPAELLEGLEQFDLLCFDQIDLICGRADWEEAFFHLYNRVRTTGARLIIAAKLAPRQLPLSLADLASRFGWGLVYQVEKLNDVQKQRLLQMRAKRRGLSLPDEVAQFIVHRSAREVSALLQHLKQLDNASLIQQRRLTIPFVKETLGW
jgi:DnaA family protein